MNIFISINNREKEIQIPVIPSSFSIQSEYNNQRVETVTHDEIMKIGTKRLTSISFSSFFPVQDHSFLKNRTMYGWDYVKMISEFRASKKPVRLVITDTNINSPMVITSFEYGVQDNTGDIYYSMTFEEYRFVDVQSLEAIPISKPKPVIVETKKKTSSTGSSSGGGSKQQATKGKYSTSTNSTVKEKAEANKIIADANSSDKYVSKIDRIDQLNQDKTKSLTYEQRNNKMINEQKKLAEKKKSDSEKNLEQIKAVSGNIETVKEKNAWERYEDWYNTTTGYIKESVKKVFK